MLPVCGYVWLHVVCTDDTRVLYILRDLCIFMRQGEHKCMFDLYAEICRVRKRMYFKMYIHASHHPIQSVFISNQTVRKQKLNAN